MKLTFTGLIALCTVAATFAEEGKFGPAWVEGHNYKVVDGQLVDLGPGPTPTPRLCRAFHQHRLSRRLSLSNIINPTPAAVPAPAPAQQQGGSISVQPWDFIVDVWTHYSNYGSAWITAFTQDGLTNYFGQRGASNYTIIRDMAQDSLRYSQWHATH